jgi:hypothetical protein
MQAVIPFLDNGSGFRKLLHDIQQQRALIEQMCATSLA